MRDIAESLDVREQGEISEQWYQQRYGNRTDALSKQKINNSTQVILKSKDAEDNYGIKLSNEQYRKFDEVYGDENSATIREHKHIKEPLKGEQLTQYRDNIQIQ